VARARTRYYNRNMKTRDLSPRTRAGVALFLAVAVTALLILTGCTGLFYTFTECTDLAPTSTPSPLAATAPGDSWVYQLQSADPAALAASGFDIVVMDYSADGSDEGAYSAAEIDTIRAGGPGTVLAYFSIGEAEEYRYYFDPDWVRRLSGVPRSDAPCWLALPNPEWSGNYKVQYWSAGWQAIVLDYLDRILDAGFDGVYLDIIDAYEYWADNENGEDFTISEREAADRMINLVLTIANHARQTDPDFLIFPQNGEPILAFDDGNGLFTIEAYLEAISGIGIEDLYYDGTDLRDAADTDARLPYLYSIRDEGKAVIVVDYVDDGSETTANTDRIADFRDLAVGDGFIPYAAREDRELDIINLATDQP
jgi:cysteinyl-tRNA synthetase